MSGTLALVVTPQSMRRRNHLRAKILVEEEIDEREAEAEWVVLMPAVVAIIAECQQW